MSNKGIRNSKNLNLKSDASPKISMPFKLNYHDRVLLRKASINLWYAQEKDNDTLFLFIIVIFGKPNRYQTKTVINSATSVNKSTAIVRIYLTPFDKLVVTPGYSTSNILLASINITLNPVVIDTVV